MLAGSLIVVAVVAAAAIVLSSGGGSSSRQATTATTTPQVDEAQTNRHDCAQIAAAGNFLSDDERSWFTANCATPEPQAVAPTPTPEPTAEPTPEPTPAVVGAAAPGAVADRMVIKRLGIDAKVHQSTVGPSGQMGDPDGPYDVVWYDFSNFPGTGGYPGKGGNAVFAGHVDYHPNIQAVFWTLRNAQAGDVIDYYTADGAHLTYTVQWRKDAGPNDDFVTYVSQTGGDVMTLITCDGVFNPATRHYDQRSVVRAVRTTT